MNEVNREKLVGELRSVSGLLGIVFCEEGERGSEPVILLYHVPEELFRQELEQAIRRLGDGGMLIDYNLREIGLVDQAIVECLEGRITVQHVSGHPFGIVNSSYAAEIHYGQILWEAPDHALSALKGKLAMQESYPEKLRQATVTYFMKEASLLLADGRNSALQGDIHFVSASFSHAVSSWVQVIHALNGQFLLGEKGGLKRANQLPIGPKQFRLRVNQIYRYFAANNPSLAYCEIDMLESEMNALVRPFAGPREG